MRARMTTNRLVIPGEPVERPAPLSRPYSRLLYEYIHLTLKYPHLPKHLLEQQYPIPGVLRGDK